MSPLLQLESVSAGYGDLRVLFGVDLSVPAGSVVALLGANGAGKTTALRLIAGLLRPTAGRVLLDGRDIRRLDTPARARRGVCLIPEGRGIFPNLTVEENLLMHTHIAGREAAKKIREVAFERFPILASRRLQVAGTMSGGEQQMLALSRALTTEPQLLLLDEISMGLAPLIVEELFEVVRELARQGMTVLLVEQLVRDALEVADYVFLLQQGRVVAVGEPADVREQVASSYLGSEVTPGARLPASDIERPGSVGQGQPLLMTSRGTLSHRASCPVVAGRADVRPAAPGLQGCGICQASEPAFKDSHRSLPLVMKEGLIRVRYHSRLDDP